MKYLLAIISVLIMALSKTTCSQGTDQQYVKLDESMLRQATSATYSFNNGSLPPEYRYDCLVTVYKDSVNLSVITGYGKEVKIDTIIPLKAELYKEFTSTLVNQSIKKIPPQGPMLLGAYTYKFWVSGKNSTLFDGEEGYDLDVSKGGLLNTFLMVLPPELQAIVKNPEQLINR